MASAGGLGRCPSIPQNAHLQRQCSLTRSPSCFRRSTSLSACRAAQRPEAPEPEQLPDDWSDLGFSSMPWPYASSTHPVEREQPRQQEATPPLMYYPAADRECMTAQDLAQDRPLPASNTTCHVILFGVQEKYETEGIYTLRTSEDIRSHAVQCDTVVAFETEVDAQRFATLLDAVITYSPTVFPIAWGDITQWCEETDTRLRLEAAGSLLIPPETSVDGDSDWERALRLQRGEFQVLDYDPHEMQQQQQQQQSSATSNLQAPPATPASPADLMQRFKDTQPIDMSQLASGFFIDGPDWVYEDPTGNNYDETDNLSDYGFGLGFGFDNALADDDQNDVEDEEDAEQRATKAIVDSKLAENGVDAMRLGLERLLHKDDE